MRIGFALCGSFCTYDQIFPVIELLSRDYEIIPILSGNAGSIDSRFGTALEHIGILTDICGKCPILSIAEAEPIGPKKLLDALIIAPCTGNTLAKLAWGITDTPVTMAVKAHLRNNRPVLLGVSTNDGLGAAAKNIGMLLNARGFFFLPMGQDAPEKKPASVVAHFDCMAEAVEAALAHRQLQPVLG